MVVISKSDLAEREWLELVMEEARELVRESFLQGKPIIPLDSISLFGFDEFRKAFDNALGKIITRSTRSEFRLPIDRSFTIKGFGTVVTGTVVSGKITVKDTVEHLPSQKLLKVRGIQIHGKDVVSAQAGDRAALNLTGIQKGEIERGDVLAQAGFLNTTEYIDCQIEVLPSAEAVKHRGRYRFHIGTAEIIGRILLLEGELVAPGMTALAQLELERPTSVLRGDRFVFRTYSPQVTVGGGMVLMSAVLKHRRRDETTLKLLRALLSQDDRLILRELIDKSGILGSTLDDIIAQNAIARLSLSSLLDELVSQGEIITYRSVKADWYISKANLKSLSRKILDFAQKFHMENPTKTGFTTAELKSALAFISDSPFIEFALQERAKAGEITFKGATIALLTHRITLSPRQQMLAKRMMELINEAGFVPLKAHPLAEQLEASLEEIAELMAILEGLGELLRLDWETALAKKYFTAMVEIIRILYAEKGIIRLADTVQALENLDKSHRSSRRATVALLEYLDKIEITERYGDERKLKV
jgi:selenocysteine-specific elongation factor